MPGYQLGDIYETTSEYYSTPKNSSKIKTENNIKPPAGTQKIDILKRDKEIREKESNIKK